MAFMKFVNFPKFYSTNHHYEMPERYRNAFYLANAAFFDSVNWYVNRAYELCFSDLVEKLKEIDTKLTDRQAEGKVEDIIRILDQCSSVIDVRFPVERESGCREVVRGFRAQHGLFAGNYPCLGGLRIRNDVTRDHMKALSALTTYKHACMGIKLAGAHGGIKIDPVNYSSNELKNIILQYVQQLQHKGYCNIKNDIIEPDLNTGKTEMAWIASETRNIAVGQPSDGLENYEKAASQAIYFALDHFLNNDRYLNQIGLNKGLENKRYLIQGLGNLGSALCKYLHNSGAICVGVKEHDGCIYNAQGVNIQALIEHKSQRGTILDFDKSKAVTTDEILGEPCDILILASHHKSLICYTAKKVQAKVIVEASNGPILPIAHKTLIGRSKLILPDLYVCSGYSIASYLEYLLKSKKESKHISSGIYKNILEAYPLSGKSRQVVAMATTQKIVNCEMEHDIFTYAIEHVMTETANQLSKIAFDYNLGLDLRTAAYIKAIRAIFDSVYAQKKY